MVVYCWISVSSACIASWSHAILDRHHMRLRVYFVTIMNGGIMVSWLIDWLIDWLIEYVHSCIKNHEFWYARFNRWVHCNHWHRQTELIVRRLIDLIDWLIDWLVDWLMVDMLTWSTDWLIDDPMNVLLADWSAFICYRHRPRCRCYNAKLID